MIKSLLNSDEEPSPETKAVVEETAIAPPEKEEISVPATVAEPAEIPETRPVFEIPETAKFFLIPAVPPEEKKTSDAFAPPVESSAEEPPPIVAEPVAVPDFETAEDKTAEPFRFDLDEPADSEPFGEEKPPEEAPIVIQKDYQPETPGETIRQSGLAYSAAIILFGSVVFMMILGWFADLLIGSSPWGIVGGIVLGGIIGFIQFFRITAQIFKK